MKKFTLALCILQLAFCALTAQAQSQLWGMTSTGGDGFGTIFKTDGNGNNHQVMETFGPGIQGFWPVGNKFVEMPNGKLLGLASMDALYNTGVIFEYDPATNSYVKKYNFSTSTGRTPNGPLMLASNGKLYGMTSSGGASNFGVLFEYDYATNTYTKKVDFNGLNGNAVIGIGTLTEAPNGKLYGMTGRGGTNDEGVIFEYDRVTNTYTKKFDMDSATGRFPLNTLLLAGNGKFYGTTRDGGANNKGVIFEYDYTNNTYTKKIDLNTSIGQYPGGNIIEATNGKIYGMTATGGVNNDGVLFEYDYMTNTYTKKADLNQPNGWDAGSLMQASNGKLYGMTRFGGTGGVGVILEYDIATNTLTKKVDLNGVNGEGGTGVLMQASNGKLYGTTLYGGIGGTIHNEGVIFEYDFTTNTYIKKIDLNFSIKGQNPDGSLVKASNGKLYGTTSHGGANGLGVLFEYDLTGAAYIKRHDFDSTSGFEPIGSLVEANGKLYGMANGGANNAGALYEYDPATNTYSKKIDLITVNGRNPSGSLMEASNGKLYGTTSLGGTMNDGVIFEYNPATNTYTKKVDLNSNGTGSRPVGSLVQAGNGKLYGMTGVGDFGVSEGWIYEYDIASNTYTKTVNFSQANGRDPQGSLTLAANGKLYGMTTNGGATNEGVIFEYIPGSNTFTKKHDFSGPDGIWPQGSLMQASNGNLYGMANRGGVYNDGVIFEYDYVNNTFTKTFDFNKATGASPTGTSLLEIMTVTGITEKGNSMSFDVYPNPSTHSFTLNYPSADGKINLTVTNQLGAVVYTESKKDVSGAYMHTFDMSKYPKGIYFVEVICGEGRSVKKIVLQ